MSATAGNELEFAFFFFFLAFGDRVVHKVHFLIVKHYVRADVKYSCYFVEYLC